jgi:NAD(P)-dependent dehydrogenase (short-subunit alcohol dehydrogenase family)
VAGRLQDKVALITGAGSVAEGWGNGKATAVLFAREGAKILAADINQEAAEETRRLVEEEGGTCIAHAADVTDAVAVQEMIDACSSTFGRIDILHNNVGGSVPGGPVEMAEADWDDNIDLNLKSVFLTCKSALPIMEAQGKGVIINVASIAGMTYYGSDLIAYRASKAGLVQFTRGVAMQYIRRGIRANTVIPGLMYTPLVAHRIAGQYHGGDLDKTVERRNAMCPMGHMGDAWDVAYAALYLASDEAKYVTATEILVDGGFTARSAT